MPGTILNGAVPVGENGYPVWSILRTAQGKSVEAGLTVAASAILARPAGMTGNLLVRVINIGSQVMYAYFAATNATSPAPSNADMRIGNGSSQLTVLKADENYLIALAAASTTTVRIEVVNTDL